MAGDARDLREVAGGLAQELAQLLALLAVQPVEQFLLDLVPEIVELGGLLLTGLREVLLHTLGGRVSIALAVDPALRRQTLEGAPLWARFATVAAGPFANFILSTLIFAGVIAFQGVAWGYTAPDALQAHCATPLLPRLDALLERV